MVMNDDEDSIPVAQSEIFDSVSMEQVKDSSEVDSSSPFNQNSAVNTSEYEPSDLIDMGFQSEHQEKNKFDPFSQLSQDICIVNTSVPMADSETMDRSCSEKKLSVGNLTYDHYQLEQNSIEITATTNSTLIENESTNLILGGDFAEMEAPAERILEESPKLSFVGVDCTVPLSISPFGISEATLEATLEPVVEEQISISITTIGEDAGDDQNMFIDEEAQSLFVDESAVITELSYLGEVEREEGQEGVVETRGDGLAAASVDGMSEAHWHVHEHVQEVVVEVDERIDKAMGEEDERDHHEKEEETEVHNQMVVVKEEEEEEKKEKKESHQMEEKEEDHHKEEEDEEDWDGFEGPTVPFVTDPSGDAAPNTTVEAQAKEGEEDEDWDGFESPTVPFVTGDATPSATVEDQAKEGEEDEDWDDFEGAEVSYSASTAPVPAPAAHPPPTVEEKEVKEKVEVPRDDRYSLQTLVRAASLRAAEPSLEVREWERACSLEIVTVFSMSQSSFCAAAIKRIAGELFRTAGLSEPPDLEDGEVKVSDKGEEEGEREGLEERLRRAAAAADGDDHGEGDLEDGTWLRAQLQQFVRGYLHLLPEDALSPMELRAVLRMHAHRRKVSQLLSSSSSLPEGRNKPVDPAADSDPRPSPPPQPLVASQTTTTAVISISESPSGLSPVQSDERREHLSSASASASPPRSELIPDRMSAAAFQFLQSLPDLTFLM